MGEPRADVYTRRMEEATGNLSAWNTKHVATLSVGEVGGEPLELLVWRNPDSGIGLMRFLSIGPRLVVTGDMDEAIYCRAPGLRWWAGLNLQYFAEKCQASGHGRIPVEWDADEALARATEIIGERLRDARRWYVPGDRGERRHLWSRFKEADGPDATQDEHAWAEFCREHGDELFGEGWWEIRFGRVISYTTACHLAGLKLAIASLDAGTAEAPHA